MSQYKTFVRHPQNEYFAAITLTPFDNGEDRFVTYRFAVKRNKPDGSIQDVEELKNMPDELRMLNKAIVTQLHQMGFSTLTAPLGQADILLLPDDGIFFTNHFSHNIVKDVNVMLDAIVDRIKKAQFTEVSTEPPAIAPKKRYTQLDLVGDIIREKLPPGTAVTSQALAQTMKAIEENLPDLIKRPAQQPRSGPTR